jgi:hypothetical protein
MFGNQYWFVQLLKSAAVLFQRNDINQMLPFAVKASISHPLAHGLGFCDELLHQLALLKSSE